MGSKKMPSKSKPGFVSHNRTQTLADCLKQLCECTAYTVTSRQDYVVCKYKVARALL